MTDLCKRLSEPFDPAIVSWRVGPTTADKSKGMALAYVDARDVMRRLDEVCGPENWQDEYPWSDGKRVVCRIGVKLLTSDPANPDRQYEWVWKTDGAGDTDTEGEKGALSDAFKRAAVKWGIGRYLYDVDTPWVQIEKRGNSYVILDAERSKLVAVLRRQAGPRPAAPPAGARNPAPPPSPVTNGNGTHTVPARPLPPHPEEPPAITAERTAAMQQFWSRDDYGIDPEVIPGGISKWDAEMLSLAAAAPNLDAFNKLRDDNKQHYANWHGRVADPVLKSFIASMNKTMRRIAEAELPA